ncbi:MAG: hypothetical protein ABIM89_06795 [Mycobacteriales bacterium]
MEELAALLGRERLLLERLLYKLVELRALLAAGEVRFLPWAAGEVDHAVAHLREAELHRALMVNRIATDAGIDDAKVSLHMLALTSPEPFAAIFAGQRRTFRALTAEVRECVAACSAAAGDGAHLVDETLRRVVLDDKSAMVTT